MPDKKILEEHRSPAGAVTRTWTDGSQEAYNTSGVLTSKTGPNGESLSLVDVVGLPEGWGEVVSNGNRTLLCPLSDGNTYQTTVPSSSPIHMVLPAVILLMQEADQAIKDGDSLPVGVTVYGVSPAGSDDEADGAPEPLDGL